MRGWLTTLSNTRQHEWTEHEDQQSELDLPVPQVFGRNSRLLSSELNLWRVIPALGFPQRQAEGIGLRMFAVHHDGCLNKKICGQKLS
jgi:hypothetical protein